MRELLRGSPFLRAARFVPYILLYRLFALVRRPRAGRVLFLSDSRGELSGNFAFLADELRAQRPDVDLQQILKPGLSARRPIRDMIRLPFLMATSPVIVLDDFYPIVYPIRLRRGTRLVQVWHAAGAFKRVGHSRTGLPGGPTRNSDIHRNYTDAYVSSEAIRADYAEAFGIHLDRVQALGVPRTDFFFDTARVQEARARIRSAHGVADHERMVLFAPTFRGAGQLSALADDSADWSEVSRSLGAGWRVAVRHHPFSAANATAVAPGVIDVSNDPEMNDLLAAADVLVTDYSSVIFEYALLRRPIVYFTPDFEDYAQSRSFYRPFDAYAVGPVVHDPRDLADAIRSASVDSARLTAFTAEFCGALDGRSSERIASRILGDAGTPSPARPRRTARLHLNVLAAHAARLSLKIVSSAMLLLPRRDKVTMITREHRRPPLDFVLLKDAIARRDPSIEVVMIARMVPPGIVRKVGYALTLLTELYHVSTSRVLVVDGFSIVASAVPHGEGLTIVQIWHALGALKKFGLSILDRPEGRDSRLANAMRMHSNYDIVIASGERCREPYSEALGVDPGQVVVAPLPRVDYLRDESARERARTRFTAMYPELEGQQVAVFAPTFRAHGTEPAIDPLELTKALADDGYATITKLHPILPQPVNAALRTAPRMSTQDLLLVADVFITDYSSAVFEAAVAGVPSYLLAPDLDQYGKARDFYLDFPHDLGLPLARTIEGLQSQLRARSASAEQCDSLVEAFVTMTGPGTAAADDLARVILARSSAAAPAPAESALISQPS